MTKTDTIYNALKSGERLTVAEALTRYGVYALSQECGRVQKKYGVRLNKVWRKCSDGVKVMEYSL